MSHDLHKSFTVDRTPAEAFAAVTDVRSWWTGEIEGETDAPGAEFSYTVPGIHYSKFVVTEFEPYARVAWLVTESHLDYLTDPSEWDGTTVVFGITPVDESVTRVDFTHVGLTPDVECFGACNDAWGGYVLGGLRDRILGRRGVVG